MTTKRRRRARRGWLVVLMATFGLVAAACIPARDEPYTVSSFGAGGVSPGLYHSLGPRGGGTCQVRTDPGAVMGISGAGPSSGPVWIEIRASDTTFVPHGCTPFWQEPGPFARPLATPGKPFGPGYYKVGYEVAPGTYRASRLPGAPPSPVPGAGLCMWARLADFAGKPDSIIESGLVFDEGDIVTIAPSDYGFSSTWGFCNWTPQFPALP